MDVEFHGYAMSGILASGGHFNSFAPSYVCQLDKERAGADNEFGWLAGWLKKVVHV